MLQYRTTCINGTSILSEADDNSTSPNRTLRLIDVAFVRKNTSSLEFLEGNKYDIWLREYDSCSESQTRFN